MRKGTTNKLGVPMKDWTESLNRHLLGDLPLLTRGVRKNLYFRLFEELADARVAISILTQRDYYVNHP